MTSKERKPLDEKRYPISELEPMPNRAAALFQLEQSRGPEDILKALGRLREILADRNDRLYDIYSRWLTEIFLASQAPPDVVARVRTLEDFAMLVENILEWKNSVRLEGEEIGFHKGEQAGLRKGELALLLRQMERKFGSLPSQIVDRLERADVDQLLDYGDRILTAKTLDDVFRND